MERFKKAEKNLSSSKQAVKETEKLNENDLKLYEEEQYKKASAKADKEYSQAIESYNKAMADFQEAEKKLSAAEKENKGKGINERDNWKKAEQAAQEVRKELSKKEIASGMCSYVKELYEAGDITETEAQKLMAYTGTDDPKKYTAKWDFQLEHPEYDNPGDSMIAAYNQRGDIDGDTMLDAWAYKNKHKKEETVSYIQGIKKLSNQQKKKLWDLIKGDWKDKGTPWE